MTANGEEKAPPETYKLKLVASVSAFLTAVSSWQKRELPAGIKLFELGMHRGEKPSQKFADCGYQLA
jgi:hypothetical protein